MRKNNIAFIFAGILICALLALIIADTVFGIQIDRGEDPPAATEQPVPETTAPTEPTAPAALVPEDSSNQAVILTPEPRLWPEETPMPYVIVTPTPSAYDSIKPSKPAPTAQSVYQTEHQTAQQSEYQTLAMEIFHLTNKVREEGGLNRLKYAYDLQDAADTRAYECSIQFSHTRPDGTSCHDIVTRDYYVTGENLILADKPIADAETLMARWMLSRGHRDNIMLPEFTELAVGVYEKNGTVFAAQIFIG